MRTLIVITVIAVLALQNANILNGGQPSDYPVAIVNGCSAIMAGQNPYAPQWLCNGVSPNTLGVGYLVLLTISGLWIVPGLAPVLGLWICWRLRPDPAVFAVLVILSARATVQGMDYLLMSGGVACILSSDS